MTTKSKKQTRKRRTPPPFEPIDDDMPERKLDTIISPVFNDPDLSGGFAQTLEKITVLAAEAVNTLKTAGGYIPVPTLKLQLEKAGVSGQSLEQTMFFLTGYLNAKKMNSPFDVAVFGDCFRSLSEDKVTSVMATLHALLYVRQENAKPTAPKAVNAIVKLQ
ncbi:MAG: hypothetical protein HY918_01975 [Candidatus Doudnabacteria bacterium]|nr:hypothetical protein [Candidatus Doudnabacteria bacterium]